MMFLSLENPDEAGFPLDDPNMRDISNSLKMRYFSGFKKNFSMLKFPSTLTGLKAKTMPYGYYSVNHLHSKWLFFFPPFFFFFPSFVII